MAGFSIVYPAGWHHYTASDPGIQLRVGPDDETNVSVRIVPFPAPVDAKAQQAVIAQLLSTVIVVDQSATVVNGVAGWQVAYPVPGSATSEVHIHVFLFAPTTLHTIVFQTPNARLKKYAHTFDLMRDSYHVLTPAATRASPAPSAVPTAPSPTPGH